LTAIVFSVGMSGYNDGENLRADAALEKHLLAKIRCLGKGWSPLLRRELVLAAQGQGSAPGTKSHDWLPLNFFPEDCIAIPADHCKGNFCHHRGRCSFCDRRLTTYHQPISLSRFYSSFVQSCSAARQLPPPRESQTWLIMLHNRKPRAPQLLPCYVVPLRMSFCYP
jgi:hypothetical protein